MAPAATPPPGGPERTRVVYGPARAQENRPFKYTNNYISTTKYRLWNFVPKNLLEQFMRIANFYFLIIALLQVFSGVSPTGRWNTFTTLCAVLTITALKEAYEDWKRYVSDRELNNRRAAVVRGGGHRGAPAAEAGAVRSEMPWRDVAVGDVIRITNRETVPADIVLLATSEPQAMAYVETSSLDGETNLKVRQALPETAALVTDDPAARALDCVLVLRGSELRNTRWAYGLVVYTGSDTKLMRNATVTPSKRSNLERAANYQIAGIFVLQLLLCVFGGVATSVFQTEVGFKHWYLGPSPGNALSSGFWGFITFLILLNNLVPISLYVTVELVKVLQAHLISSDARMYHAESDTPAAARTSNLNEELGQVQYLLSDKTGTLTCNVMRFRKCAIGGVTYGGGAEAAPSGRGTPGPRSRDVAPALGAAVELRDIRVEGNRTPEPSILPAAFRDAALDGRLADADPLASEFFRALSLCHTVVPEAREDGGIAYQASSPDEAALVDAAAQAGFRFEARAPRSCAIRARDAPEEYALLAVNEFNSTRKRMSVLLRAPDGRILLYCKGADNVVMERLRAGCPGVEQTDAALASFASEGLRTLLVAWRVVPQPEFDAWIKRYEAAAVALSGREEALDAAAEEIERGMDLLGATAIEDKLQDGVPEAIAVLLEAGIRVWVLTGDKQETAVDIGFACRLLDEGMEILTVNHKTADEAAEAIEQLLGKGAARGEVSGRLALVIDGPSLGFALDRCPLMFLELATRCTAVICCRVSPLQKALVVQLVREHAGAVTLAIGDGANDVPMIQAAHIGVGISGQEGLQAVRAADYAIAQFRFLQRLLLVHGRWAYRRVAKVMIYSFYKNIVFVAALFWFTFASGWSGVSLYEQFSMSAYNLAFTSLPIVAFGVLDRDIEAKTALAMPQLYSYGRSGAAFGRGVFWSWMASGLWHSLVVLVVPLLTVEGPFRPDGTVGGFWAVGVTVYSCVVLVVTLKLALQTRSMTWLNGAALSLSCLAWFAWGLAYGAVNRVAPSMHGVLLALLRTPAFYLALALAVVTALGRDFAWAYLHRTYDPNAQHIVQEIEKFGLRASPDAARLPISRHYVHDDDEPLFRLRQPSTVGRVGLGALGAVRAARKHHGYAFAQEEGQRDMLASFAAPRSPPPPAPPGGAGRPVASDLSLTGQPPPTTRCSPRAPAPFPSPPSPPSPPPLLRFSASPF
eukprot:tig00021582_g22605.t1